MRERSISRRQLLRVTWWVLGQRKKGAECIQYQSKLLPFSLFPLLSHSNPDDTQTEAVHIPRPYTDSGRLQTSAFLASGFRLLGINDTVARVLPCPLGTFSNPFTQGTGKCTNCPPGKLNTLNINFFKKL